MTGKTPDDDDLIDQFHDEVALPGHHVVSYDPAAECVAVLSADASRHLREILAAHGCEICGRVDAQLEVQEQRLTRGVESGPIGEV